MDLSRKEIINIKLEELSKSNFRMKFRLDDRDKIYIKKIGINKLIEHAYGFIEDRLSGDNILNDGKQTPMNGHPVFVAQHATATCCRGCLYKWHKIDKDKKLTTNEINYVVSIIIEWINKQIVV